jgi:hypothetical protein
MMTIIIELRLRHFVCAVIELEAVHIVVLRVMRLLIEVLLVLLLLL